MGLRTVGCEADSALQIAKLAKIIVNLLKCHRKLLTLPCKNTKEVRSNNTDHSYSWGSKFIDRHPVMANIVIIFIIAALGIYAAYLATAIFTKHGRSVRVPSVENLSYTEAISKLHDYGLKVDIRDSLYRDDIRPGFVIEQFPKRGSIVKPGRKIFLYINAVHPKEVILDDDNHPNELALKGLSERAVRAKFEELGFKNVNVVKVLGTTDRVVKITANGRPVHKMQKIPVNATIVIEIADGRLNDIQDSLSNLEYLDAYRESQANINGDYNSDSNSSYSQESGHSSPSKPVEEPAQREPDPEEDNSQYF